MSASPQSLVVGDVLVRALIAGIDGWLRAGKLLEGDLDERLSANARVRLESPELSSGGLPLEDAESLVAVIATQLGEDAALAGFAERVIEGWREEPEILAVLDAGQGLVDGPGFAVCRASDMLLGDAGWAYEGGRAAFSVRLDGLGPASTALRILVGALLSRLAECVDPAFGDVRFDGIDGDGLRVFAVREPGGVSSPGDTAALERAAVVG